MIVPGGASRARVTERRHGAAHDTAGRNRVLW
jgi:hypothetical protein